MWVTRPPWTTHTLKTVVSTAVLRCRSTLTSVGYAMFVPHMDSLSTTQNVAVEVSMRAIYATTSKSRRPWPSLLSQNSSMNLVMAS